jgi:WD40 repeat protein
VKLYDLATGAPVGELPSLVSDTGLVFSADGKTLAASGDDTTVRVADVATGELRFGTQSLSAMYGVALSPDERRLFTANQEGSLAIYDARNGRLLGQLGDPRDSGWVTGIAANAEEVISADDLGHIRFWPVPIETRAPADVSRDIACRIPLELVANRLIPRALPPTCGN